MVEVHFKQQFQNKYRAAKQTQVVNIGDIVLGGCLRSNMIILCMGTEYAIKDLITLGSDIIDNLMKS